MVLEESIAFMVVAPLIFFLIFRKFKVVGRNVGELNSLLLMPLVWLTICVPISKYKEVIFEDILKSILLISFFVGIYLFFIVIAIFFSKNEEIKSRRSYMLASLIHNVTLGVILSLMYLNKEISLLMILANISLIIVMSFTAVIIKFVEKIYENNFSPE